MNTVLVLNFGGQYCHLIARRVRENGVYSQVVPCDISPSEMGRLGKRFEIKGMILSGGPASIYEKNAPRMDKRLMKTGVPILGICYGHQLLANYAGGVVKKSAKREYGASLANVTKARGILKGLSKSEKIWMSHGDTVFSLPRGFETLASTENCPVASFANMGKGIYGVQWHPEVMHTEHGNVILRNFIFDICGARRNWKPSGLIQEYANNIRSEVGKGRAIMAMSGGVDSSTAAVLASRAIGKRLTAVFVDNGLMRKNEAGEIGRMAKKLGINLISINAAERFIKNLEGIADPEEKRRIIGREFIRVFEEVAKRVKADYLLQGTIYPDRIESGSSKNASVIKTHHNVGGLPSSISFKGLIEPLKDLYKDEVREVAIKLGVPSSMVHRQPFPGPGLAVRIMGAVTREKLRLIREVDAIVREELDEKRAELELWQYFAVLTDTKSTGVKGDERAYGYVAAIRCVGSRDAMTARFAKIPYDVLEKVSSRITNEVPEISRVVYDISNKPPSTIEWE